ncbi:MAG TPA: adenylosuccinate lyase [Planctomycetota bacterium]|nr:adenylosuccinate lyase [Planctomycetota bacterium]
MNKEFQTFQSPLTTRYGSPEMLDNFSDEYRFQTHRRIWIALAEAERQLGLPISARQIAEMTRFQGKINYSRIADWETRTNHDVMAHIKAFGEQCPKARPIIHLGATSAMITDNADLIIYRNAIALIKARLVKTIKSLSAFVKKYQGMPCCGFTHLQPALLTTVGKRACMWLQDLISDFHNLEYLESNLKCLGAKGAIGTQASFLSLFNGNAKKVGQLDKIFVRKLGFNKSYIITGQVYPRKQDYQMLSMLSGIAQSAHKFSQDMRLLQGMGELEEPFGREQVGSSAMPYKRNPVSSERITSLARFVILLPNNLALTHSGQWLERSLDDSANRRISIPEAFLATDAILKAYNKIAAGITVYEGVINRRIEAELPFMMTEEVLMKAVNLGADRQELHQRIREHSMEVIKNIKEGGKNDLLARLKADPAFAKVVPHLKSMLKPKKYIGLAEKQAAEFLKQEVTPIIRRF